MSFCKSCGAEILWAHVTKSGRSIPVDAAQDPTGNVVLRRAGGGGGFTAEILTKDALLAARTEGVPLHWPHHGRCPDGKAWKNPRG